MSQSQDKIDAIYELRDSAAAKAKLEMAVDAHPTAEIKDALLDATLDVEAKTQHAIEVCHECGHVHANGDHTRGGDNVIQVDFGQQEREGAGDAR
jgi:hypothetical protein